VRTGEEVWSEGPKGKESEATKTRSAGSQARDWHSNSTERGTGADRGGGTKPKDGDARSDRYQSCERRSGSVPD